MYFPPMRMCLGCRVRADRTQLVRVVAASGPMGPVVEVDHRKVLPGRGAWLHPSTVCLSEAVRRKAFASALWVDGIKVDLDVIVTALLKAGDENHPKGQVAEDMRTP